MRIFSQDAMRKRLSGRRQELGSGQTLLGCNVLQQRATLSLAALMTPNERGTLHSSLIQRSAFPI